MVSVNFDAKGFNNLNQRFDVRDSIVNVCKSEITAGDGDKKVAGSALTTLTTEALQGFAVARLAEKQDSAKDEPVKYSVVINKIVRAMGEETTQIWSKDFDSRVDFETFYMNVCQVPIDAVGFMSASFLAVGGKNSVDFAKTLFLPTTTLYSSKSGQNKLMYCLAIIWDVGTLLFRVLTLPYRLYELSNTPKHSLLAFVEEGCETSDLHALDVHIRAAAKVPNGAIALEYVERIIPERHFASENGRAFHWTSLSNPELEPGARKVQLEKAATASNWMNRSSVLSQL